MKSLALIALLLSLSVAFAKNPAPAQPANPGQKANPPAATVRPRVQKVEDMMDSFQTMEKGFWQAWKDRDAKPFEQHMAPNSLIIDNTGIADKATAINGIAGCD